MVALAAAGAWAASAVGMPACWATCRLAARAAAGGVGAARRLNSANRAMGPSSCPGAGSMAGSGARAAGRKASPHSMQRKASMSLGIPQAGHMRRGSAVPQMLQNRAPISASWLHVGQWAT